MATSPDATDQPEQQATVTEVIDYLLRDGLRRLAEGVSSLPVHKLPVIAVSVDTGVVTAHLDTPLTVDPPEPWKPHPTTESALVTTVDALTDTGSPHPPILVIAGIDPTKSVVILNLTAFNSIGIYGPNQLPISRSWIYQVLITAAVSTTITVDTRDLIPYPTARTIIHEPPEPPPPATLTFTSDRDVRPHIGTITIHTDPTGELPNMLFAGHNRSAEIFCNTQRFVLWRCLDLSDDVWDTLTTTLAPPVIEGTPQDLPHQWVRVLGPLEISAPNPDLPALSALNGVGKPNRDTELLVQLALAGTSGLSPAEVLNILWPNITDSKERDKKSRPMLEQLSKLRRNFGVIPDSEDRIILKRDRSSDSSIRINPALTSDWATFCTLVPTTPAAATTENLRAAISLVRGAPFQDAPPDSYRLSKHVVDTALDLVADSALTLAERELSTGDASAAFAAAEAGLLTNPQRQDLWNLALQIAPPDRVPNLLTRLRAAIPASELKASTRTAMERVSTP